jgi:hypothetical protein
MAAAGVTAAASTGGGTGAGNGPGTNITEYMVPIMSAYLGQQLVVLTLAYSDEAGLLAYMALIAYGLSFVPEFFVQWWARHNDGVVDPYERLFVTLTGIVKWLMFFVTNGFAFAWIGVFFTDYALPPWYIAVALAVELVVIVFAWLPYTLNAAAASTPSTLVATVTVSSVS